ncbi:MAG: hypothetical protein ACI8ZM_003539 [Crocinitomix sp.]|jgi:hypothetical protein
MKHLLLILAATCTIQSFSQAYFQQEVDYNIDVQLYDQENILRGFEKFDYKNNSTDDLSFIYIHLWPNAYKNNETALAKQLYGMSDMNLQFADAADQGYIDSLDFKVNDATVTWEYDPEHIDICKLILAAPLKPGESITVSTPFKVKIPSGDISRLGFVKESYQITQWYPKPAVYDLEGWHQMPYLTQGEFYSEYGTFDVSITLPKNYVVGATGDLQTESEIEFLNERAIQTAEKLKNDGIKHGKDNSSFPDSDKEWKTIRYTQKDVHDFAWFADKRFEVLKGEVELPNSGEKVTSWAMFVPHHTDLWRDAIEYLNDAIYYYSKWNGDYPYKHVTAVDGTISAGGGMEYPNITVIGDASSKEELEVVIVHEVGHNWFYGLLGSNERDHAWMDEGLNTLNEIRYMQTKYPNNKRMSDLANGIVGKLHFEDLNHQDMSSITYTMMASNGIDQPIGIGSNDFTPTNYGAIVYAKTGLVFMYLKDYLGDAEFDKAMQAYYDEWHYKHPQPADIRRTLETETGKDLTWLFDDLIQTTKQIDYKVKGVKIGETSSIVKVKNIGQVNSPVRVDALNFGKVRESIWIEPGAKVSEAEFKGTSYDQFIIDANKQMPEVNRNNNYWTKKGLFHRTEPFKMEFIGGDNEGHSWNSYWLPAIGVNAYDKFMIGAIFHNQTLPKNKLEYTLAPMFSVGRRNLSGFADINYSWIPEKNIRAITLGAVSKTFGNGLTSTSSEPTTYYTLQPYLNFELGKPNLRKYYKQHLQLQGHYIREIGEIVNTSLTGASVNYEFEYSKRVHSVSASLSLDYYNNINQSVGLTSPITSDLMNLGVEFEYALQYWDEKNKSISVRAFLGQNIFYNGAQSSRYGFALGGQSGTQDVTYDQYMFGRNQTNGLWANQRLENHGGFRTTAEISTTTGAMFTTNLYAELPYIPLVGAFADFGMFDNGGTMTMISTAGLGIKLADRFGIYFPLYESSNLKAAFLDDTPYGEKIRFTLNLSGISLSKLIPRFL